MPVEFIEADFDGIVILISVRIRHSNGHPDGSRADASPIWAKKKVSLTRKYNIYCKKVLLSSILKSLYLGLNDGVLGIKYCIIFH